MFRTQVITGAAMVALVVLAFRYTIQASADMRYMGAEYAFWMWAVMMVAMMTPSAAPMVFAFSRVSRSQRNAPSGPGSAIVFLLGYLVLWTGFSAAAAVAQALLGQVRLLSSMGVSTSRVLSAALLISAGAYQFTPWKFGCLSKCRSPLGFLLTEWRDGIGGAFVMGLRHGLYCIGCCWLIMALLFVAGVMNLAWIAALTVIVLAEKLLPFGPWVSRIVGAAAVLGGAWFLIRS